MLMGLGTGAVYPLLQAGVADYFSGWERSLVFAFAIVSVSH